MYSAYKSLKTVLKFTSRRVCSVYGVWTNSSGGFTVRYLPLTLLLLSWPFLKRCKIKGKSKCIKNLHALFPPVYAFIQKILMEFPFSKHCAWYWAKCIKDRVLSFQVLREFTAYIPNIGPNTWSLLQIMFCICVAEYGFQNIFFP